MAPSLVKQHRGNRTRDAKGLALFRYADGRLSSIGTYQYLGDEVAYGRLCAGDFEGNTLEESGNLKMGVIDTLGNVVLPFRHRQTKIEGQTIIAFDRQVKGHSTYVYGYSLDGQKVFELPCNNIYDTVIPSLLKIIKGKKEGLIRSDGKLLLAPTQEWIRVYPELGFVQYANETAGTILADLDGGQLFQHDEEMQPEQRVAGDYLILSNRKTVVLDEDFKPVSTFDGRFGKQYPQLSPAIASIEARKPYFIHLETGVEYRAP